MEMHPFHKWLCDHEYNGSESIWNAGVHAAIELVVKELSTKSLKEILETLIVKFPQRYENGYYRHKENGMLCECTFNDTDDYIRFFSASWGPHGRARPGQYIATDGTGFSRAFDPKEFKESFEWFCDYNDERVTTIAPDITSPDFLKPRDDVIRGKRQGFASMGMVNGNSD